MFKVTIAAVEDGTRSGRDGGSRVRPVVLAVAF